LGNETFDVFDGMDRNANVWTSQGFFASISVGQFQWVLFMRHDVAPFVEG
jgi:hypothetical protein